MSYISVNVQYLRNLAATTRSVESSLREFAQLPGSALACSPKVDAAYQDLNGDWDKRRNELAAALDAIADGFSTAADGFEATDAELAAGLSGD